MQKINFNYEDVETVSVGSVYDGTNAKNFPAVIVVIKLIDGSVREYNFGAEYDSALQFATELAVRVTNAKNIADHQR